MNIANSIKSTRALLLSAAIGGAMLVGCTPVNKVRTTLALNDLHIQAAIAEDNGDDVLAKELWGEYVDRRPQSALAEYRLGSVETRLGEYDQAIGHLRIAHDLEPGNIEYLEALAHAMAQGNRTESLMKLLRQTITEGPSESGYFRLARYAQQVGQMDEAKEALNLAISLNGGQSADPYMEMANFASSINDTQSEIMNLRYALWFNQSDPTILSRLESLGMITGPSLAKKPGM